jgi:hypothetical protein
MTTEISWNGSDIIYIPYIPLVQEIQEGLKLNGTRQQLVYADGVNLSEDNIDTLKKKSETSTDSGKQRKLSICFSLVTKMQGKIMT